MSTPMSAAQAAQQGNRDGGGRYAEKTQPDPGGVVLADTLNFSSGDPDGRLNDQQRNYMVMLNRLMGAPGTLSVSESCGGQRYAKIDADPQDTPGTITIVSCDFYGDSADPTEVYVGSAWRWTEKVSDYDIGGVNVTLVASDRYDEAAIAADVLALGEAQARLDERLNKPALRRDPKEHNRVVDARLTRRYGDMLLQLYINGGQDTFKVENGHIVEARVYTQRYGVLNLTDRDHVDRIVTEMGRELSLDVPGIDLPNWRERRPSRREVEAFLFGEWSRR